MIELDGSSLSIESLRAVADGEAVRLAPAARRAMAAARQVVEEVLAEGSPAYGLTTGVAERKSVVLTPALRRDFSRRLVKAHLVAQGPPAERPVVRAVMACLVNGFAKGAAGVRPELADMVLDALNGGREPVVRSLGSVGESDLGPLADLADGLIEASGFELRENEGLALVNSNAFSTGWAALAVHRLSLLLEEATVAAALDLEAFGANANALHPVVGELRRSPGTRLCLARLHALVAGSSMLEPGSARNLQDPLTFRCVPQVHGAARDGLGYVRDRVEDELNSSQGNPVVVASERRIVSVGNFEPAGLAAALDFGRLALAPVVSTAAERTVKLLQSPLSGLPAGLAARAGTGEDALAEYAVASQSIAAEACTLVQPVSSVLVSTSKAEGIEDRTTMAPLSARRLEEMVDLACRVVALELLVAAQAVELREGWRLGAGTGQAFATVREIVPFVGPDELPPADLETLVAAVRDGQIASAALVS